MTYVGFSRPTHLLGLAIHKSRFDALYAGENRDMWRIVKLYVGNVNVSFPTI